MTYQEQAEQIATQMNVPDKLRERVIKDLVNRLYSRHVLRQIEEGRMYVKPSGNSYVYQLIE